MRAVILPAAGPRLPSLDPHFRPQLRLRTIGRGFGPVCRALPRAGDTERGQTAATSGSLCGDLGAGGKHQGERSRGHGAPRTLGIPGQGSWWGRGALSRAGEAGRAPGQRSSPCQGLAFGMRRTGPMAPRAAGRPAGSCGRARRGALGASVHARSLCQGQRGRAEGGRETERPELGRWRGGPAHSGLGGDGSDAVHGGVGPEGHAGHGSGAARGSPGAVRHWKKLTHGCAGETQQRAEEERGLGRRVGSPAGPVSHIPGCVRCTAGRRQSRGSSCLWTPLPR